jgi:hypothetical protein
MSARRLRIQEISELSHALAWHLVIGMKRVPRLPHAFGRRREARENPKVPFRQGTPSGLIVNEPLAGVQRLVLPAQTQQNFAQILPPGCGLRLQGHDHAQPRLGERQVRSAPSTAMTIGRGRTRRHRRRQSPMTNMPLTWYACSLCADTITPPHRFRRSALSRSLGPNTQALETRIAP